MSGYSFIIGIGVIIFLILLWIPLNEVINVGDNSIVNVMNNQTTDANIQAQNTTAGLIFYYSLFVFIIIIGIAIMKHGIKDEPVAYGGYYGQ